MKKKSQMNILFPQQTAFDKLRALKAAGRRIVFVSGNFNIVHPGHLRLLSFAKSCGDILAVGVQCDRIAGNAVFLSENYRLEAVKALSCIDITFLLTIPAQDAVAAFLPDVVVKGKEHESMTNAELPVLESYGGTLLFSSGEVTFSSFELMLNEQKVTQSGTLELPDYFKRHHFSKRDIERLIGRFKNLRIAVIGDTIIDEYILCNPVGMSREEPVIVVTPQSKDRFIGGAAIVSGHAASLGARVTFYTVTGKDEPASFFMKEMSSGKIDLRQFEDNSRPTTLKQRFRANGHSLLRCNTFRQHEISQDLQQRIFSQLSEQLDNLDLLVFSDFNYGILPQALVDRIADAARAKGVMMIADSQTSSQSGDISRYHFMKMLTPTEYEARVALQDFQSGLVVLAEKLRRKTSAENLLITLGRDGILIHAGSSEQFETDRIPALNTNPRDVSGAGDSLLITSALVLAAGGDIWQSAFLGSIAAARQVSRIGNIPLKIEELIS